MRAGNETTVESRLLLSYFRPQKLKTVYVRILNFICNFHFTYKYSTKQLKVP